MDKLSVIYNAIVDQLELEMKYGGMFEGFKLYQEMPRTESLFFPCIILIRQPVGIASRMFGGGYINTAQIILDLAFKEKKAQVQLGAEKYITESLVSLYEARCKILAETLDIPDEVIVSDVDYRSERHYPEEKNQELYGLSFYMTIQYYEDVEDERSRVV